MNQDSGSTQEVVFNPVEPGTYRLSVELFSLRDLGGVLTGRLDTWISLNSSRTFISGIGENASSVKVTPESASMQVQVAKQFYATGYASANRAVFSPPAGFSWTELGGHASVNSNGLALGLSPGPGSIRATELSSGIQNSATYSVQNVTATTSKWTILVFLNAANDLHPFSTLNVNQMERVAQNSDVRMVVQWKQSQSAFPSSSFNGTRRYLVRPDTTNSIASDLIMDMGLNVDMGDKATLLQFINWAKTYYPAQRYALVVWNHGNGWRRRLEESWITRAVSYDDETGNAIQIWDLQAGLGNNVFEILAWDASLMQMVEVASEVQDQAKFIVGSEESPPGEGYPYDDVFDNFRDNPDSSTANLSKAFVDAMLNEPAYATRKITQSVIDSTKMPALEAALNTLGAELIANSPALTSVLPSVRTASKSYSPTTTRVYRDLIDVCERIMTGTAIGSVDQACADVIAAAQNALVWEGHNSNSPGSRGISIDFSRADTFASSAADYALLRFAQGTSWNEYLLQAP
jgi:hypothetical protein